jgi:WhiB family redox-sensing transcriptional regulator
MDFIPTPAPWVASAACPSTDPEVFFPEKGGSTTEARKVCSGCPVRLQCLDAAMRDEQGKSHDSRHGVRGGLSPRARVKHQPQWLAEQAVEVEAA